MLGDNSFSLAKRFLCFVIDLKVLYDFTSKQSLFFTFLIPVILRQNKDSVDRAHTKARQPDLTFKGINRSIQVLMLRPPTPPLRWLMSRCPLKKCFFSLWNMLEAFVHHREAEKRDVTQSIFSPVFSRRVC